MSKDINTVTISTEEYNRLRDFNEAIRRGDVVMNFGRFDEWHDRIYTKDEALIVLNEKNKNMKITNIGLNGNIDRLNSKLISNSVYLSKVKEMNIFQFLKWKRKN